MDIPTGVPDPKWDDGCPSCSAGTDELSPAFFEHLHTRDTSYTMVSRAPLAKLERWKALKGWDVPWYSSYGTGFNVDFGVTIDASVASPVYNFRTEPEYQARGENYFDEQPVEMPRRSCSFRRRAGFSIRTRSTRGVWSRPAARITSST